ncbi:ABC transporter substrate-binding protein [Paracraurococcus ruber]|nr:extracellular solute-binding protein [Paracraurococcus ruber]
MTGRRHLLAAAAAGALSPQARAQALPFQPERGASLRLLRWGKFLDAEERATTENIRAFTEATGVEVRVDSVWQDDVHPQLSVAASIGSGPDVAWTLQMTPQLLADKLLDLSDLAAQVGQAGGGWYRLVEQYGMRDGRWIGLSPFVVGVLPVYRISTLREAGFERFPADTDGFLRLVREMKRIGKPAGFALSRAPNDGNSFAHWLLWSHGGKLVDERNRVAINSPETIRAIEYAREVAQHFIPGTQGWNDASNNGSFLNGQVHLTNNAVSIYGKALADRMEVAADIDHALWPVGPVGQPAELHIVFPFVVMRYTRYPNAAKALLAFLMDPPRYRRVLEASVGYLSQGLRAYDDSPVWTRDPKVRLFRDVAARGRPISWAGTLGPEASAALADSVVADMFAEAVGGQATAREAAARAERRAQRIYRG